MFRGIPQNYGKLLEIQETNLLITAMKLYLQLQITRPQLNKLY